MKTVNLLPQWYVLQGHRQKLLRLHVAVMVLMGTGMCSAAWLGRQKLAADQSKRDRLVQQLDAIPDVEKDLGAFLQGLIVISVIFVLVRPRSQGPAIVTNVANGLKGLITAATGGGTF